MNAGSGFKTSDSARVAALARWAKVSPNERAESARRSAYARWERNSTPEERAAYRERVADLAARRAAPCLNCAEPVGHARRKCCGKAECHRALRAAQTAERRARQGRENYGYTEAIAEAYHRRRALKRGATVERFSHVEVFERDNWTCGICSEPVDRDRAWPDPMSVSLDHVVPLTLGGDHSLANTQCAHLTCNVRKGARVA